MVVIRVDKYGNLVNSKPCVGCTQKLKCYGVKKITYSDNGKLITVPMFALFTTYTTTGCR